MFRVPTYRFDDRPGVDPLAEVKRHRGHLERSVLRLAGPREMEIEVRIVCVRFLAGVSGRSLV